MCRIAALMVEIRCRISLVSHHCEANPACLNGNRDFWVMSKHRVPVLLLSIVALVEVHWAQGVDNVCPQGWEEKARAFSEAKLNGDVNGAAEYLRPDKREMWAEWTAWDLDRSRQRILGFSEEVQERVSKEKDIAKQRLAVSVYSCMSVAPPKGRFRIQMDPDGRSYSFLTMAYEDEEWWVEDNLYNLAPEQKRVFTAYTQALDAGSWEEAEAWVARAVLPRFASYRAEVSSFLSGGGAIAEAYERRAAARAAEWDDMFIRAEMESEDIIVVHAEFPTAESVSSEMVKVDGTWRILFR